MSDASSQPPEDLPPCLPGLELREKIGVGGLSVVYRAVHLNLQRAVAVKILHARSDAAEAGPTWLRESRLMASLAHPHVVAIHDAGQVEGHSYLVMEDMAGGSLRSRMRPGWAWSLAAAVPVLDRIARALEHIHQQGVLHLDLKPENVLYAADGQIKITDFGLSLPQTDAQALLGGRHFQGTLDYAAPEQCAGRSPDGRYDVFSLATLAYELLTGRLPGRVYVPASQRNPQLPVAVDEVLRRGLARDPPQRYASIAEFRLALAGAARPARSKARVWWLTAAASLTALAVLTAFLVVVYLGRPDTPPSPSPLTPPTALWALHDEPDDLSLFTAEEGGDLPGGPDLSVQRVRAEKPLRAMPPELPLPVWPTPRPVLVVRSPGVWGFVHPLADRTLGRRVVRNWSALVQTVVPADKNFVKAGQFDGDCLAMTPRGQLWRVGGSVGPDNAWRIALDRPPDAPDNPALRLNNLDAAPGQGLLGCYQPLQDAPGPGATVVLRYRARARHGKGSLAVYAAMPVALSEDDPRPEARRIRDLGPADPSTNLWPYRVPAWVTPTREWQMYLVVLESPPVPTSVPHRKLVIDVSADDDVWVDDVELFVWQPGSEP